DRILADRLRPAAAAWAARTKARVVFDPAAAAPDVDVLPPDGFGVRAAAGDYLPVPPAVQQVDHAYQWPMVFGVYRDKTTAWGGVIRGLPLGAGGDVLVYRADVSLGGR